MLLYVSAVSGSVITEVKLVNLPVYSTPPPVVATSTVVSGTGTGATFYPIMSICCGSYTSLDFFNYTGGDQQFIVPAGVRSIIAHLFGGGGGGGYSGYGNGFSKGGGGGAYIVGELDVTPGSTVTLSVGGGASKALPDGNAGGYGGGGNGSFAGTVIITAAGGGGGGGSKLKYNNTDILIAGGGGGGGGTYSANTNVAGIGGGGASNGGNGVGTYFGYGGSNTGGAGGINGNSGVSGQGGDCKFINTGSTAFSFATAAGGGGYYGGGGSGYTTQFVDPFNTLVMTGGGGGAGSSYFDSTIVRSVSNSPATTDGTSAGSNSPYYQNGIGIGGIPQNPATNNGGNGLIVLIY